MTQTLPSSLIVLLQTDHNKAKLTAEYLSSFAFRVKIESDEASALTSIRQDSPDLVILDGMLSGRDGVDLCRELRVFFTGPLLMLTAHTELVDEIIGLEMGADDYLQKPVDQRLLLARVKALLRRSELPLKHHHAQAKPSSRCYKFAHIEIDDPARRVFSRGAEIYLTTPQYELLLLLAKNAGKIMSRDYIFQALRGIEYDGVNRFVDITVSQIRAQIHDTHTPLIKTVRGQGYLLVPEPMSVVSMPAEPISAEPASIDSISAESMLSKPLSSEFMSSQPM
jgi:two-component system response regulator RstA